MTASQREQKVPTFGIHLNLNKGVSYLLYPEWILPADKDEWINRGVIIWDSETKRVICLSPHQALDVLDDLRESTSWKSEPFFLSWDSYSFPFSEDDRKELRLSTNRRNILGESSLRAGKTNC